MSKWPWLAIAVLAGCHKSEPPPPADQAAACAAAIAGAQQRAMDAKFAADHRVASARSRPRWRTTSWTHRRRILAPVCASDRWAPEVLACLDAAATDGDDKKCLDMLSAEQTSSWHKAAAAVGRGSSFRPPP